MPFLVSEQAWSQRLHIMAQGVRNGYRISIRPDPKNPKFYLWTLHGTRKLFWEESASSYKSVEQAIFEAQAKADQLD